LIIFALRSPPFYLAVRQQAATGAAQITTGPALGSECRDNIMQQAVMLCGTYRPELE